MDSIHRNSIVRFVNSIVKEYKGYTQNIFGIHQTHAIYGLSDISTIDIVKNELKKYKANKFRVIKNKFGFYIISFNALKMNIN